MYDFDNGQDVASDVGGENTSNKSLDSETEALNVYDASDVPESDVELLEVDDDITDTIPSGENISKSFFDDFSLDELDDGNYHATHLTEKEVQQIDDLWREERAMDVEPYQAKRMTEDEVTQIDELNKDEALDVEPYHAFPDDLDAISEADTDRFAAEIEALTLDELEVEQERLDKLHNDTEMDIFGEYDAGIKGSLTKEQYHDMVDGLPKEALEHLQSGLKSQDKNVLDYFGLGSSGEDSDNTEELTLKRRR